MSNLKPWAVVLGSVIVACVPAEQVVAGAAHACARYQGGAVSCWGLNDAGQTGQFGARANEPKELEWLPPATALSAAYHQTCAITQAKKLVCWGGLGVKPARHTKVGPGLQVDELSGVHAVAVTGSSTCASLENGEVWCWGTPFDAFNGVRDGGDGSELVRLAVQPTHELWSAQRYSGVCGRTDDGDVWCAGVFGGAVYADPQALPQLRGAQTLSVGVFGICGVMATGSVVCVDGQNLGAAGAALSVSNVRQLTTQCALTTGGDVTCAPTDGSDIASREVGWWCWDRACDAGMPTPARKLNDRAIVEGGPPFSNLRFLCGIDSASLPWCRSLSPRGLGTKPCTVSLPCE